jgi:hypothetical protein
MHDIYLVRPGFVIPPQNQGQIVEYSYAWDEDGILFRRVVDKSDQSEELYVADNDEEKNVPQGHLFVNGSPEEWVEAWKRVDPKNYRFHRG